MDEDRPVGILTVEEIREGPKDINAKESDLWLPLEAFLCRE